MRQQTITTAGVALALCVVLGVLASLLFMRLDAVGLFAAYWWTSGTVLAAVALWLAWPRLTRTTRRVAGLRLAVTVRRHIQEGRQP